MKKFIVLPSLPAFPVISVTADIQSPPGGKHNRIRKLSRGVGNVLYGINELPTPGTARFGTKVLSTRPASA